MDILPKLACRTVLVVFCMTVSIVFAESLQTEKRITQYAHSVWQSEDELPSRAILSLTQSDDGYLWLGTFEGLVRFDGLKFRVYNTATTPELQSNSIWCTAKADGNTLWIGTNGGGLTRYQNGTFEHFGSASGLGNTIIRCLVKDSKGNIWAGGVNGVSCFNGHTFKNFTLQDGLLDNTVNSLAVLGDTLFVGTNEGLNTLDANGVIKPFAHALPQGSFSTVLADTSSDTLYIAIQDKGLFRFHKQQLTPLDHPEIGQGNTILALLLDNKNDLWAGTQKGLFRLHKGGIEAFTEKNGLSHNQVNSLLEDKEGNLWIGTYRGGLNRLFDGSFLNYTTHEGLAGNIVYPIHQDKNGVIWAGTVNGLSRLENNTFKNFTIDNGLPDNLVRSIDDDGKGNLWIGTYRGGVSSFDGKQFTNFSTADGLPSNKVRRAMIDCEGTLWVGTGNGLARKNSDNTFSTVSDPSALATVSVITIQETADKSLWVATDGQGLFRKLNNTWTHFNEKNGLVSDVVFFVMQSRDGGFLVSTQKGISRIEQNKIHNFRASDGLHSDSVFFTLEDNRNRLWMGSNRGLFSIELGDLDAYRQGKIARIPCTVYGKSDGMKTQEINAPAHPLKDRDGNMWIPTINGIAVFNPADVPIIKKPPSVIIESVQSENGMHTQNGTVLAAGTQRIDFRFSALSFRSPEKIQFRIMLEGFDKNWVYISSRRDVQYTNLSPGKFIFRVQSSYGHGDWSDSASFPFEQAPFFYERTQFYVLGALLIILVSVGYYKFRINEFRRTQRLLEEKVTQRTFELKEAMMEAQQANRSKSEFLAMMSHEIRTPMNGVIGMINILLSSKLNEQQRRHATTVQNSAQALLNIINDILDFSKIESGKMTMECIAFNLVETVEDSVELLNERAREKGIRLYTLIDPTVPEYLMGDPTRLRQILLNLGGNAIKFTDKGYVKFHVQLIEEDGDTAHLRVRVSDTGIGVSEEAQTRLFKAFEQADSSTTRKYGGTGLGLAITQRLVIAMNGTIGMTSEIGKGSCFSFTVKLKKRENPPWTLKTALQGKRICIIDEDTLFCESLTASCIRIGLKSECRFNTADGIEYLEDNALQNNPFDFVILSRLTPKRITQIAYHIQDSRELDTLKILWLTETPDITLSEELGIRQRALDLPVNTRALEHTLDGLANGKVTTQAECRHGDKPTPHKYRLEILLADDSSVNQEIFKLNLEGWGHSVDCVFDGKEAIEMLGRKNYDCVLMDSNMPIMDGIETTHHIRNRTFFVRNPHIYIIAATANAMAGDRERYLGCGMNDYTSKPIQIVELWNALQRAIVHQLDAKVELSLNTVSEKKYTADSEDAKKKDRNGKKKKNKKQKDADEVELDEDTEETAIDEVDDEQLKELPRELIELFIKETENSLSKLESAVAKEDVETICKLAHNIEGIPQAFGAERLSHYSASVTKLIRDLNYTAIRTILPQMHQEFAILKKQMAKYLK